MQERIEAFGYCYPEQNKKETKAKAATEKRNNVKPCKQKQNKRPKVQTTTLEQMGVSVMKEVNIYFPRFKRYCPFFIKSIYAYEFLAS